MEPERLARIVDALADGHDGPRLDRLLRTATELIGVATASVAIVHDGEHRGTVACSDPAASVMDELQFTVGEGPTIDADRAMHPILEADLDTTLGMWPAFAPLALEEDCHATFAFPLRVGAARVGVLTLYHDEPGALAATDVDDAISIGVVATNVLLSVEEDLDAGALPERLVDVLQHRRVVHQATGMVAAQLDVDTTTALARLRAWAWARDRLIDDVAAEIVSGVLRFAEDR